MTFKTTRDLNIARHMMPPLQHVNNGLTRHADESMLSRDNM